MDTSKLSRHQQEYLSMALTNERMGLNHPKALWQTKRSLRRLGLIDWQQRAPAYVVGEKGGWLWLTDQGKQAAQQVQDMAAR
jgi:hypothetical protein